MKTLWLVLAVVAALGVAGFFIRRDGVTSCEAAHDRAELAAQIADATLTGKKVSDVFMQHDAALEKIALAPDNPNDVVPDIIRSTISGLRDEAK